MSRAPRHLVHHGVVDASAILVDGALLGPREARRRVVAAWTPGAAVHRAGAAFLVRFPAPRPVDCARALGAPLVRVAAEASAPIASAPLAPDELADVVAPPGSVVLVRAGVARVVVPADADREEPERWLDLAVFTVVTVEPLGAPPAPPVIAIVSANVAARDLLGIASAPAEQASVSAALSALARGHAPEARGRARDAGAGHAVTFLATVAAALASLLGRFFAVPPSPPALPASSAGGRRALAAVPAEPAGPSLGDRIGSRLRSWFAELLVRARLAQFVGRRQAEYLGRLLDMLDRGDVDEALRHAIPLGGTEGAGPVAPALGVPTPRSDLSISLGASGPGSAMFAASDLYAMLRAKYRAIFERLEREGRIDEAAFVLAELLRDEGEAVAFLERHGRLRLAAELAEARALPAGLVVRQWFLAGEVARAVRIARRHGAFADAIERLGQHERARELRVLWAETLAEAGDFAAAVEVIWPVERARHIGAAWIERAIQQGGTAAVWMLVKKLELVPASFADVRDRALAILAADDHRAEADRRALAAALAATRPTPEARTLARPVLRALVRDGAGSADPATQMIANRLCAFAEDGALRADMPAWPTVARPQLDEALMPRLFAVDAADVGATPILDAAHLPNGRIAVALGEAGVRVLGRSGKTMFHLDQPAHRLVVSDHGDRAIAVARRGGGTYRLARLDLLGRRSEVWCEAHLDAFAPDFDGSQWVVARGQRLLVVDVLEQRFEALEELHPGGFVHEIGRSRVSCLVVVAGPRDLAAAVRYDLPAWQMRERTPEVEDMRGPNHVVSGVSGAAAALLVQRFGAGAASPRLVLHQGSGPRLAELSWLQQGTPHAVSVAPGWIACAIETAAGIEVCLLDDRGLRSRLEIALVGARSVAMRLSDTLTLADDRGRLLVVDLAHGDLVHDLRL